MAENTREQRRRKREYEARQVVHDVQVDRRRTDNKKAIIGAAAVAVVAIGAQIGFTAAGGQPQADDAPTATTAPAPGAENGTQPPQQNDAAVPDPAIAEDREWTGTMQINDVTLDISIDGKNAPQAAANFIDLAKNNFYKDVTCHRITTSSSFKVLQCGDPDGTGMGGPGYEFGPVENAPEDGVYKEGVIAMARAQDPNSMGSQFFIVYGDTPIPDPTGYTVFGEVTGGLDDLKSEVTDEGVAKGEPSPEDGKPAIDVKLGDIKLK
ncbi:peptidylprolyl isomerase [Gulosibacter bifidus]|uniref:peptidylprolyl isomerase n=1 Tax=Gulosibacter bifidus TaxID=272239 RepID=A0ABW5RGD2_9MICO|nr:peptidylprolyl isomerase [Gulosibacter bifidus]